MQNAALRVPQPLIPDWSFTAAAPIEATSPRDNDTIDWSSPIKITFRQAMDHASAEAALSIEPEMKGVATWQTNTLTFKPYNEWVSNTLYPVSLPTSLKMNDGGRPLKEPIVFQLQQRRDP